jgi:TatD DNase family protein
MQPGSREVLYDAHNHLQDERLKAVREDILRTPGFGNIQKMVVNGSCEADWPEVLALAQRDSRVIPSFGYHPWYVKERSPEWVQNLDSFLRKVPSAVGEIGLDRWIEDHDFPAQAEAFTQQLAMAAEYGLPVSIHCLQAWGPLLELLKVGPIPSPGFLLHSFGGPKEMIDPLTRLGGYFSLPGYFAHERKGRQREAFRQVPRDRLLIETDAPDQCLPPERERYSVTDATTGKALNHPGNLEAVYAFGAELLEMPLETLIGQVGENFRRLFGKLLID